MANGSELNQVCRARDEYQQRLFEARQAAGIDDLPEVDLTDWINEVRDNEQKWKERYKAAEARAHQAEDKLRVLAQVVTIATFILEK